MLAIFHSLVRQVASYPVPVSALVQGYCLGGAFELALCCHLVFATPTAMFACPEIKLGVIPPVLAAVGPLRLGFPTAERLLLTGDNLDAVAAQRLGLVTEIFQKDIQPEEEFLTWYRQRIRPLSAFAIRQATRAVRFGSALIERLGESLAGIEQQYIREILTSDDGREGIAAFLEHRDPVWRNS
jgi:cyclohexa-1,5-dienecarbonyl-CoA hydratase